MHTLSVTPLVPFEWLGLLVAIAFVIIVVGLFLQRQGMLLRLLALIGLAMILVHPVWLDEQRASVKSVVAVVVDRSPSQDLGQRTSDSNKALQTVRNKLSHLDQFEPRYIEAAGIDKNNAGTSTELFKALETNLSDIPPSRFAGAILITDGQVHDIPETLDALGLNAPINALITGKPDEYDRQIRFIEPAKFGLTSKPLQLSFIIDDHGKMPPLEQNATNQNITVNVLVNGEINQTVQAKANEASTIKLSLPHAGPNTIELQTPIIEGEVSSANNKTITVVEGIKQNLRVLLVSGEPNNGTRIWRDLLKSDTSVDLVHFTILRPPEKADNTPINQLSLIVFPTTELFVNKINNFDLVIFDRYQHYSVLPLIYYDYMAQYVRNGGALLMTTGPEFAGQNTLAKTPLISALPALPNGNIINKGFTPTLTEKGKRHPVTRDLEGSQFTPPKWGRWLRQIGVQDTKDSTVLMTGDEKSPLVLLDHVGKGRVGMMLSDEGGLWARGFEGGGPYAALYRRMAHWLMKQPELEEEALTAKSNGQKIYIQRQTINDAVGVARVIPPSGKTFTVALKQQKDGIFSATVETNETGLFRIDNDKFQAIVYVGLSDALEARQVISTTQALKPITQLSGGHISRLHAANTDELNVAAIQIGKNNNTQADTIVLQPSNDTRLLSSKQVALFGGLLALMLSLALIVLTWFREGQ